MKIDIKKNIYLYGEHAQDSCFYLVYSAKDHSYLALKRNMKSLEGVFAPRGNFRKRIGTSILSLRKDKMKEFEEKYNGEFIPFEK